MRAYEQVTNLDQFKAQAKADIALRDGWIRRGYPAIDLAGPLPWNLENSALRSWNFYIHSFDMLDSLLAAYDQTKDRQFLDPSLRISLDWARKHPRKAEGVSPMAWYDMAVGLRAYRLAYLYQAAQAAGILTEEDAATLWAALDEHRAELADDDNIAFHNNHGYFQVAGQLALGRRFADVSPDMAALHRQGAERLRRMLDQQFTDEGVHREHSPDYHRMVLDTLLGLIRSGLVEDEELRNRAAAIEDALAWFVYPSGTIVNFGDSDSRKMTSSASAAGRKWTRPLMQSVASAGATGGARPAGLKTFDASGYAIVRQPSPHKPDDHAEDSYLALAAAFHSRTHKHADDLGFVWYDRGQPVLVDSGRYGYIGKTVQGSDLWLEGHWYSDPMRVYMESTRAHNTLEFDGRNFPRKGAKPYGSGIGQSVEEGGVYAIEARAKHFGSIWYERILIFRPRHWLVVFDVYRDNLKEPHDVMQWFHTAPGNKVASRQDGYQITLSGSGDTVFVHDLLEDSSPAGVISGQNGEAIQGWWSGKEREAQPAPAFGFTRQGQPTGAFATLFSFNPQEDISPGLSRTNETGRKALLQWTDANGKHRIELDRTEGLKLSIAEKKTLNDRVPSGLSAAEFAFIKERYAEASVIMEYGSGGTTLAATKMAQKLVLTIEPNSGTAKKLIDQVREGKPASRHFVHPNEEIWKLFNDRHPDVILVQGTERALSFASALRNARKPVIVLFKDFLTDPMRSEIERILSPDRMIGSLAEFEIEPTLNLPENWLKT